MKFVAQRVSSALLTVDGKPVSEIGGGLVDARKGNRPSFTEAERPERADELYALAAQQLRALGVSVKTGVFGAHMVISQVNDGPVTIVYEVV